MLTFILFISAMLIVSLKDVKDIIKGRQTKLIVLYAVLFGLSLALAAVSAFELRAGF